MGRRLLPERVPRQATRRVNPQRKAHPMKPQTITQLREDNVFWTMRPPKDRPCGNCPWRASNFDQIGEPPLENDATFAPATRSDLWKYGERRDGRPLGADRLVPGPRTDGGLRNGHL